MSLTVTNSEKRTTAKYLEPAEVPEEIRYCLDFEDQFIDRNLKRPKMVVARTCVNCGEKDYIQTARVRMQVKSDGFTGRCARCWFAKGWRSGETSTYWKGGKYTTFQGYVKILTHGHPYADASGYVLEHRLVMEKELSRYLKPHETVHHKNGIRNDNRPENLEVWTGNHGNGVRLNDLQHCDTCQCAEKSE